MTAPRAGRLSHRRCRRVGPPAVDAAETRLGASRVVPPAYPGYDAERLPYPDATVPHSPDITQTGACEIRDLLDRLAGKWSLLVVELLGRGSHRFTELHTTIDGISRRMLTLTLRQPERDGLVRRTVHPVVPPRVDYDLQRSHHPATRTPRSEKTGQSVSAWPWAAAGQRCPASPEVVGNRPDPEPPAC